MVIVRDLSYAYPDGDWVLRGLSLRVEEGEFLSIMGPTGAGKSTLCFALNGIVPRATGGRIRGDVIVDGLNTKQHSVATLGQKIGVVFQNPETQLFNMSVETEVAFGLESLGLPRQQIQRQVEWALEVMRLERLRERSPAQLSGGEKQRLAIAAVMAMSPKVLVLDEPSSNLDPMGKREVFRTLRELRDSLGLTVIMTEHESELVAEFSDRVAVIDAGEMVLVDTPERVLGDVDRMRKLGLAVPQVSEIAHCLNQYHGTKLRLTRYDQALSKLAPMIHAT